MTFAEMKERADYVHAATVPRPTAAQSANSIVASAPFKKYEADAAETARKAAERRFYQKRSAYLHEIARDYAVEVRPQSCPGVVAPLLATDEINNHSPAGHQRVLDTLLSVQAWLIGQPTALDAGELIALLRVISVERQLLDKATRHDTNFGGM